ncbi:MULTISPECIES: transglutaminase domain-containing protein [Croceibacter]|uniref:transglutaminase domain-containing protein n=1 Tax=Croceibacter TaxID=216431 RepID=UPI000C463760|nr:MULTISPECIES: transglutaminase domain-containing protein [Croceibacter]MBG26279.1 transglutaminase [Croceibacter sp.]HAT70059.1 transglutaminase [Flavobacteriaceae bacterium]|tara:strand:+ start:4212 stop:4844 length:633 start_codon:yes stop_codon:yes gene_type:complete
MSYLKPTYYFDFDNDLIQNLISEVKKDDSKNNQAIRIYTKIRDEWLYDPYHISFSKQKYRASHIAQKTTGNCVEKSILLIACLRALNIPARLHLGKVKNHIAVERLEEKFGTNELTPHGMVNVFLNNEWLKMSPAFNATLCEKFNVEPLEFDGYTNSYLQQYNTQGDLFMEYLEDYGHFNDVPLKFMIENLKTHYPHIFKTETHITEFKI